MNNNCQAGHKFHSRVLVGTNLGQMIVYDWNRYKDFKGYCTGQDDVSRTLISTGVWEAEVSKLAVSILEKGDHNNLVVDIGCNIGWYSRIARMMGYKVEAFDGDKEHLDLLNINATGSLGRNIWFDNNIIPREGTEIIEFMKCDIEGNEQYAIRYFEDYFKNKKVNNLIMEISPIFNSSYIELVNRIMNYGYQVLEIDGKKFDFNFSFKQKDLWFKL